MADDEERGALGMHYTSVPNILKVLNPLFLDELREKLAEAGDNSRKLLNLRNRMARIRVFDPACGSGNFLVIAYKQMRAIEAEINQRRGEADRPTEIPLTNFRGIELRDFPAEIARLALIIAEYQCDLLYRGKKLALAEFLPLDAENWITCGNALRIDWLSICPPTGTAVRHLADDLFDAQTDQAEIDFENEGGETYICGNPPYLGKGKLTKEQKAEMRCVFEIRIPKYGYIDFVASWLVLAADFLAKARGAAAFVTTNSICQGRQAPLIWSEVAATGNTMFFAHTTFRWANSATRNAAVMCVIVGFSSVSKGKKYIYTDNERKEVEAISPYLTPGSGVYVTARSSPLSHEIGVMQLGNKANDGGFLSLSYCEAAELEASSPGAKKFLRRYYGSKEYNNDIPRYCLWISDDDLEDALQFPGLADRVSRVRVVRLDSPDPGNRKLANSPHQFREMYCGKESTIFVPIMTSVRREYIPCGLLSYGARLSGQAFGIYDGDVWQLSILLSKIHFTWIAAICGRLKEDYRYSNDLGWNTFPVPTLTEKNKADLTRCAENILLAREAHFPATIAELYDPENMPANLREAHERNDEVLERIYIGRRFKNDTERLEKLFELYTRMTESPAAAGA
ncbi:MAG: DNA methyltransferase [Halioglobus sp.]